MTQATGTTLVWRCASATENFNWIKIISDAFTAVGFVKHTDTGQVSLTGSTVTLPTTPDTNYQESGYEIRKLVSAGKPTIYCRVGYGVATGPTTSYNTPPNNNVPRLRMFWGTTTDGAGNVGGVTNVNGGVSGGSGVYNSSDVLPSTGKTWYIASDGGNYLSIVIDPSLVHASTQSNAQPIMGHAMERTANPDTGVFDSDGFVFWNLGGSGYPANNSSGPSTSFMDTPYQYCVFNITSASMFRSTKVFPQGNDIFSASGVAGSTPLFPCTTLIPAVKAPSSSLLWAYTNDVNPGAIFATTVYGTTRTYMGMSIGNQNSTTQTQMNNSLRPCIRID